MTGKHFLYILIATFLTIIIWVTLNIFHARAQVQISPETKQLIEPVNPSFDQEVLNGL